MKGKGAFFNLLISLLLILVVYPEVQGKIWAGKLFAVFFSWVLVSAVYLVSRERKSNFIISLILGIPTLVFMWLEQFIDGSFLDVVMFILMTVFTFFVFWCVISHIMRSEKVTANTLAGAASAYLLLGISWGFVYALLEFVTLGASFSIPEALKTTNALNVVVADWDWAVLHYFSFSTLTTLGYGDITPITSRAQSLALLEAVSGVLFTALLVSRLVGMYIYGLREGK
ncbi:MAG: ion channel [Candidatus Tantalella remota]|nr:ion channel [Candidatus Tantalella remota]